MATRTAERGRPLRNLRPMQWLMIGTIVMALGLGGYTLPGGAMVAYVPVAEAKAQGRNVQIFGYLYSQGAYDQQGRWHFDIQDENDDRLTIVYPHAKPANFEQAIGVVAIGRYDQEAQHFVAD